MHEEDASEESSFEEEHLPGPSRVRQDRSAVGGKKFKHHIDQPKKESDEMQEQQTHEVMTKDGTT